MLFAFAANSFRFSFTSRRFAARYRRGRLFRPPAHSPLSRAEVAAFRRR